MPIKVYQEFERSKKNNKPISEYPGWYYEGRQQMDDLRETIKSRERALERGYIHADRIDETREKLKWEKERLSQIEESSPRLSGDQKDKLAKLSKDLGGEISDAMFTRTDMKLGLADAHDEANRIMLKKMSVNSEDEAKLATEMGIQVVEGKVTRKDKERMWKVAQKALGEPSNTEVLRRDRAMKSVQYEEAKRRGRPPGSTGSKKGE